MTSPVTWIGAFAFVLIVMGLLNRRRRAVHISLMTAALLVDLGIVLYLELTRAVVESTYGEPVSGLLAVHIAISCVVLALYASQVYTGIRKARGERSVWHARLPIWFIVARLGNLVTSFMVTAPS